MSDDESPLGTLSDGGMLHTEGSGGPTPPSRRIPWLAIVVTMLVVLAVGAVAAGAVLVVAMDDGSGDGAAVADTGPSVPAEPLPSAEEIGIAVGELSREAPGGRAQSLEVQGGEVSATVEGGRVLVYADESGVFERPTPGGSGVNELVDEPTFSLSFVEPGAPGRIDAALRGKGESLERAVYAVDPATLGERWEATATNGAVYFADEDGRGLCPEAEC